MSRLFVQFALDNYTQNIHILEIAEKLERRCYCMGYPMLGAGFGDFAFFGILFWIILMVDLILLGVFLWKHISRMK